MLFYNDPLNFCPSAYLLRTFICPGSLNIGSFWFLSNLLSHLSLQIIPEILILGYISLHRKVMRCVVWSLALWKDFPSWWGPSLIHEYFIFGLSSHVWLTHLRTEFKPFYLFSWYRQSFIRLFREGHHLTVAGYWGSGTPLHASLLCTTWTFSSLIPDALPLL